MKKRILLLNIILIAAVAFIGCDKAEQKTKSNQNTPGSIVGMWELRELHGGMLANPYGPYYPPGNGDRWKFTDSLYERYVDGKLVLSGKYSFAKDANPATGTEMEAFILEPDAHMTFFEFSNDTLVLYNGIIAADGTISKYVRQVDK